MYMNHNFSVEFITNLNQKIQIGVSSIGLDWENNQITISRALQNDITIIKNHSEDFAFIAINLLKSDRTHSLQFLFKVEDTTIVPFLKLDAGSLELVLMEIIIKFSHMEINHV